MFTFRLKAADMSRIAPSIHFLCHAFARKPWIVVALCVAALPAIADDNVAVDAKPSSLFALHSDITFSMFAPPRKNDATADAAGLKSQIARVSETLHAAARGLYGEKMKSLGAFDVYVADSTDTETLSSSSGKIALYGGIAGLAPTDDWLAFVIAREMGHVLAGHHDDNSTASIITSVIMNLLLPGSGLLKSALSLAGSQTAAAAGGERQKREADDIAVRLLETSGYRMRDLALSLATGPSDEQLGNGSWALAFRKSVAEIVAKVRPAPAAQPMNADVALAELTPTALTPIAPAFAAASAELPAAMVLIAAPAPPINAPPLAQLPLPDLPVTRSRPSGIAGPLLLGGFSVPSRRVD